MTSETASDFTDEQQVYYKYLRRRLAAGEAGSRMSMGDAVIAQNKLTALLAAVGAAVGGKLDTPFDVTDEMKALCDLLYVEISPGGEDAS
jgi:hypothetical protein